MSQNKLILDHLKSGKTLNPLQALRLYKCFRLAARISDLREDHDIKMKLSNKKELGKGYAIYSLSNNATG